ncbi:MAG TPA: MobF family relaxase [Pirellulales bacterium]|nr:MobF family relaxase [Pirellulales bacterium]
MLRVFQNKHVAGAKSYYTTADYYSEGQDLTGYWRGKTAELLGVSGEIQKVEWDALCDNLHPKTGERLTLRQKTDRTVGYDFNFHVPKSVSLLYAMTRDDRILDAFRESVDETMHDIERDMATRVRKGGRQQDRNTGNMAWGEFIHFTARPEEGVPDPHLHAHCFVFNTTYDPEERSFKAGQFRDLKRDAPYFEAVFHARMAHRMSELGLSVERTKTGWELSGIDRDLVEKFSRRTAEIERKAREKGIVDPQAKAELGAKTRESKQKDMSLPELQATWESWMTSREREAIRDLEQKMRGDAEPADPVATAKAMQYAIGHEFTRQSVLPERRLLATALKHGVGQATVEQIHDQAERSELIVGLRNGRRMVSTREVLAEEEHVVGLARSGRGACRPFVSHYDHFERDWLNAEQKAAVRHIVESRDKVMLLRGAAGVGKTSLLQEAVEAIEKSGTQVFAFAPSTDASHGVLRDTGFADADTVARLLVDEKLQKQVAGQLILVDEAGQMGIQDMNAVLSLADRLDARVLLSGDRRQHSSVARGAALRQLEEEAGIVPAEVKEIQRQSGEYKQAVRALSDGLTVDGFDALDRLGWVKEIDSEERYRHMAADYLQAVGEGATALVVSPTHAEARRITGEIRQAMHEAGTLGKDVHEIRVLKTANLTEAERTDHVNFAGGDVLVFHQNAKGYSRGQHLTVTNDGPLPLDQARHFQLYHASMLSLAPGDTVRITKNGYTLDGKHELRNGMLRQIKSFDDDGNPIDSKGWVISKDYGHLDYGYVVTSHASQGKTVDRVFIGQSSESFPASSREQFYVSASRGKKQVVVYTDDKEELRDAINRSDDRITATGLIAGSPKRQAVLLHHRYPDMPAIEHQKEREYAIER